MHLNGNKTLFSKCKILYISYDGILEPLGQSQVLAYLINLQSEKIKSFLPRLQFIIGRIPI